MTLLHIKHLTYSCSVPGKTLIITGAVHGDERCGPEAINRLAAFIDGGGVSLVSGKLILVPVCNPGAYKANTRFIDRNLNRYLFPKDEKNAYEDHIDPVLCAILKEGDMLLDLHSYPSPGGPFVFLGEESEEETAFARALGVNDFVKGWSEAYGNSDKEDGDEAGIGTTEYSRRYGVSAVTLECGYHPNPDAPEVGYRAALLAMRHCGLIADLPAGITPADTGAQRVVKMRDVFYKRENAALTRDYGHFDDVSAGEAVVRDDNGKTLYAAPADGCIVLPHDGAKAGQEWFYFGVKDAFPAP